MTADRAPKTVPPRAPKSVRPVTVKHLPPHDGRLPVTLTFVPVMDVDAKGGVFIDLRQGNRSEQPGAMRAKADPVKRPASELKLMLVKGDAAIAALAADEAKGELPQTIKAAIKAIKAVKVQGNPIISHQIAKASLFTTGQSESFRAEVSMPSGTSELGEWYFRGRIATNGGHDLHSKWQKVNS